ncbi:MAG: adenosylcobinamide amidohydrolase [Cohaesibacter sp.]|nr:adenosylcobinamide amidohydrolase [Cohaesibacter sp.]
MSGMSCERHLLPDFKLDLAQPWLSVSFSKPLTILSWALNRPGFVVADHLVWRQVRNADLPPDLDVECWLDGELASIGCQNAVAMLTSRSIDHYVVRTSVVETVKATCIATVGLSNGERVGHRIDRSRQDWGTINLAVVLNQALTEAAFLEVMSIATQARTVAICDASIDSVAGPITGTGTDCIAIAASSGACQYAGLHTALGEAIGRSVYDAIAQGVRDWLRTFKSGF